jgi:hypothetical protein
MANFYCNAEDRKKVVVALQKGGGRAQQVEASLRSKTGGLLKMPQMHQNSSGARPLSGRGTKSPVEALKLPKSLVGKPR